MGKVKKQRERERLQDGMHTEAGDRNYCSQKLQKQSRSPEIHWGKKLAAVGGADAEI